MASNALISIIYTVNIAGLPKAKLLDKGEALENAMQPVWTNGYKGSDINDLVEAPNLVEAVFIYDIFLDKHH